MNSQYPMHGNMIQDEAILVVVDAVSDIQLD